MGRQAVEEVGGNCAAAKVGGMQNVHQQEQVGGSPLVVAAQPLAAGNGLDAEQQHLREHELVPLQQFVEFQVEAKY